MYTFMFLNLSWSAHLGLEQPFVCARGWFFCLILNLLPIFFFLPLRVVRAVRPPSSGIDFLTLQPSKEEDVDVLLCCLIYMPQSCTQNHIFLVLFFSWFFWCEVSFIPASHFCLFTKRSYHNWNDQLPEITTVSICCWGKYLIYHYPGWQSVRHFTSCQILIF